MDGFKVTRLAAAAAGMQVHSLAEAGWTLGREGRRGNKVRLRIKKPTRCPCLLLATPATCSPLQRPDNSRLGNKQWSSGGANEEDEKKEKWWTSLGMCKYYKVQLTNGGRSQELGLSS